MNDFNSMRDFFKKFAPDTDFDQLHQMAQEMDQRRAEAMTRLTQRLENMPQQEKDELANYLQARIDAKGKR